MTTARKHKTIVTALNITLEQQASLTTLKGSKYFVNIDIDNIP